MIHDIIKVQKDKWINSSSCTVKEIIKYIKEKGKLRDTQIEAIEVYLFLKIEGDNKPLWQLFSEGLFIDHTNLTLAEQTLLNNNEISKLALYQYCKKELPILTTLIEEGVSIDYEGIIKKIFYDISYSDYLLSLPMGAGKTYLMASFIYLDLYFALNEPNNKNFAHNFLILIPSGLKNSIAPSLKTIANFDASWILEEKQAQRIQQLLRFDILDVPKNSRKDTKTTNPNAQKVSNILPNPFGQIFVVNAEKVILEGKAKALFEDEIIENELKQKLAQIPNLSILIDEVHHAASDDIKLRQVVSWWHTQGNITTVLGFSGTPYLKSAEKIYINDELFFKFKHITNTVYYYPLTTAIENFLKKPKVKRANFDKKEILSQAIKDFNTLYKDKVYEDGTIAKCAIYCSSIQDLEEVVYPHLTSMLNIPKEEILKFHKGNKEYKIPSANETQFRSLDLSSSNKRYILLVQVGKEGWDCKSLTSVILSGQGDSPRNMVLQTSCRCLRQADSNDNTALIWLNESNAKILDEQLQKEQNTSIEEINNIENLTPKNTIQQKSRTNQLNLPTIDFYQLKITYTTVNEERNPNTKEKLSQLLQNIDNYKKEGFIHSGDLENTQQHLTIQHHIEGQWLSFNDWLFQLIKNSFLRLTKSDLNPYLTLLEKLYNKITTKGYLNELVEHSKLNNDIALCFSIRRSLNTKTDTVKQNVELLIASNLKEVESHNKLYPSIEATHQILKADNDRDFINEFEEEKQKKIIELTQNKEFDKIADISNQTLQKEINYKDKSFHYLPYDFQQSGFEKEIIEKILTLESFNNNELEIYYNGQRGLTNFVIQCYTKEKSNYRYVGNYTTDFLMIKRDKQNSIQKILIIETKGEGFANDKNFKLRKEFINGEFITSNNKAFGYKRFDFLYLEDRVNIDKNLSQLDKKIEEFFKQD